MSERPFSFHLIFSNVAEEIKASRKSSSFSSQETDSDEPPPPPSKDEGGFLSKLKKKIFG